MSLPVYMKLDSASSLPHGSSFLVVGAYSAGKYRIYHYDTDQPAQPWVEMAMIYSGATTAFKECLLPQVLINQSFHKYHQLQVDREFFHYCED